MRTKFLAISLLFVSSGVWAADAAVAPTSGFTKADFRSEVAAPKLRKLLGVSGGNLYIAKQDGSVDVVDKEGKSVMTLAAKSGDTELLRQPEAAAVSSDTIYVVDSKTGSGCHVRPVHRQISGPFRQQGGRQSERRFCAGRAAGVAVHEGVVYVADTGNERIQMFGINGVFLSTLSLSSHLSVAKRRKRLTSWASRRISRWIRRGASMCAMRTTS